MNNTEIELKEYLDYYRKYLQIYGKPDIDCNVAIARYSRGVDRDRSLCMILLYASNMMRRYAMYYDYLTLDDLIDSCMYALNYAINHVKSSKPVVIDSIEKAKWWFDISKRRYYDLFFQQLNFQLMGKNRDKYKDKYYLNNFTDSLDQMLDQDDEGESSWYNKAAKWDDHDYLPFYQYLKTIDDVNYKYYLWYIINYGTSAYIDTVNFRYCVKEFVYEFGDMPTLPDKNINYMIKKYKQYAKNDNTLRELLGLDKVEVKPVKRNNKRVINSDTGEIFDSISDAAKSVGRPASSLSVHLTGKTKTCGGYHFAYAD